MDDVAPELGQDDPLREQRYQQGTACVYRPCYFAVLKMINLRVSYFGVSVHPSMNPSRVQLRRFAIPGSLITLTPKHVLTICRVCPVAVTISRAERYTVTVDQ